MNNATKNMKNALKWSAITEFLAKIISPIINMCLARILAPQAFGVLATITMVISFAEIFVESGFQKFLIQHQFESQEQEEKYFSVAFWSNLFVSCVLWGIIIVFRNPLAEVVGSPELGMPIAVTGVVIPIYGMIGVQSSRLKKKLEFKPLFYVRIITALVPLVITLPLALLGLDYWALIIGNFFGIFIQFLMLFAFGKFRPAFLYSFPILKHMLSYGVWTLLDGLAVWLTAWVDSLLISRNLSDYYLGLYKNSTSTVSSLFGLVTAAITPVLFSSLAQLQNDDLEFKNTFLKLQRTLCTFLLPLSVGMYIFRDFVTYIFFGSQWSESANVVGVTALSLALRTIFVRIYSEAYRAKGKFYLPLILQIVDLSIIIPSCIISINYGFWALVYTIALARLPLIILEIIFAWKICKIGFTDTLKELLPCFCSTAIMAVVGFLIWDLYASNLWIICAVIICIIAYFSILFMFKRERETYLYPLKNKIVKRTKG